MPHLASPLLLYMIYIRYRGHRFTLGWRPFKPGYRGKLGWLLNPSLQATKKTLTCRTKAQETRFPPANHRRREFAPPWRLCHQQYQPRIHQPSPARLVRSCSCCPSASRSRREQLAGYFLALRRSPHPRAPRSQVSLPIRTLAAPETKSAPAVFDISHLMTCPHLWRDVSRLQGNLENRGCARAGRRR